MNNPEVRFISENLKALGEKVISKFEKFDFITENNIRIVYLESNKDKKSKGGLILGECEKIPEKYSWAIDYDFAIIFYIPNIQDLTDEQKEILMEHELMHIGQDDKGNLVIVPHDIEDFSEIIGKYGLFWDEVQNG